ncbi:GNAT family N-acetyltransferase [Humibacter soli]
MLEALALPAELTVRDDQITIRRADMNDLGTLMRLMADDPISAVRGDVNDAADTPAYARALARIFDDPSNDAIVAIDSDGAVIGTLQLTSIPGMARLGSTRLLLEGVRVASDRRSSGIGSAMIRWVMDVAAPAVDASLVELSSSVERTDARRFYLRLGFADSHVGFKFPVADPSPAAR